jgi:hypothetical protein
MEKSELEQQVNDIIHCFICFGKVYKPYMCPKCHKLYCLDCLKQWYSKGAQNCAMCKTLLNFDKFIPIPWMDDLSNYMIQEQSKVNKKKNENLKNSNSIDNDDEKITPNESQNESNDEKENNCIKTCNTHNDNDLQYYCIECNKNYCSDCLLFSENDIHKYHKIFKLSEIINYNLQKNIDLYQEIKNKQYLINEKKAIFNNQLLELEYDKENKLNNIDKFKTNVIRNIDNNIEDLKEIQNNINLNKMTIKDKIPSFNERIYEIIRKKDLNGYKNLLDEIKKVNIDNDSIKEIKSFCLSNHDIFFKIYQFDLFEIENLNNFENLDLFNKEFNHIINDVNVIIDIKRLDDNDDILFNIKLEKKNDDENQNDEFKSNFYISLSFFDNSERSFKLIDMKKQNNYNKKEYNYNGMIYRYIYEKAWSNNGNLALKLFIYEYNKE